MIRRMVLLVVLILALAASDRGLPTSRGNGQFVIDAAAQEELLDLAWLAPSPADLDVEGYGLSYGVYQTAAEGGVSVFGNPGPITDYDETFSTAGARQTYFQMVSLRSEDDPDIVARQVSIVLAEFADDDAAESGLAAVVDLLTTHEQTRTPPDVGDEAVALRGEFTLADGRTYDELRFLVRSDRFLADLMIDDYSGDAPAASEFTPLAELLVERFETAEAGESPGLAFQVPRLAGEELTTFYDYYTRRGGDEVPAEAERTSQIESDDAFFEEAGVTDTYYYTGEVLPTEEEETYVSLISDLRLFTDEESAEAYLETEVENWIEVVGEDYQDVEIVDDAAELGDGSATVSFSQETNFGEPTVGYRIWVRAGDRVAAVELDGVPEISLPVAEEMAERQLACLEDGACLEPIAVSELMQGEPDADAEEETPEGEEEETPDAEADETPEGEAEETPEADAEETPESDAEETPEARTSQDDKPAVVASDEETPEGEADETVEAGQDAAPEDTTDLDEAPTEVTVSITSAGFDPDPVTIPVGGTVTWVNDDTGVGHAVTVLSDGGVEVTSDPLLPNFGSFSHTFTEPGAYPYVDVSDNTIQGTIIVETAAEATGEETAEASQDAALETTGEVAATETYVSPTFGYALSYDPTVWEVVQGPSSENGVDFIGLDNGFTKVELGGTTGIADAQVCVQFMTDDQTSQPDVTAFEPLLDETGAPIAGGDPSDAFAATRLTDDGGTSNVAYVRCVVLPSGDAVLIIGQFATEAFYDTAAEQREQLLEGLTMP